jgi:hypothetical protein
MITFYILLMTTIEACSQIENELERTKEKSVVIAGLAEMSFVGYHDSFPVFRKVQDRSKNEYFFFYVDESKNILVPLATSFEIPMPNSTWETGFLKIIGYENGIWIYTVGYMKEDYSQYFQHLWIQFNGKNHFVDSVYNADKKIHFSVSSDRRHVLIGTLNTLAEYYNEAQDNRFIQISLDSVKMGRLSKKMIPCMLCADGYLVKGRLFFTRSETRDDFDGGFAWTDIYSTDVAAAAPEKIASFSDLIGMSADGQYILVKRIFDLPNSPRAIVHVPTKKYQLLLGREYYKVPAFYSLTRKVFVFQFGNRLVYVNSPSKLPFNALERGNAKIPNWTEKAYYNQFQHPPFD